MQLTVRNTEILATAGWKWKMCRGINGGAFALVIYAHAVSRLVKIVKMYSLRSIIIILPKTVCFTKDNLNHLHLPIWSMRINKNTRNLTQLFLSNYSTHNAYIICIYYLYSINLVCFDILNYKLFFSIIKASTTKVIRLHINRISIALGYCNYAILYCYHIT